MELQKNRDIKFRAWSYFYKKMYYDVYNLDGYIEIWNGEDSYNKLGCSCNKCYENKGKFYVSIMQYIGYKDKYDEEIYEGDIIKRFNDNDEIEYGIVKYDIVSFTVERKSLKNPELQHIEYELEFFEDCEIIGNIYENNDLFENMKLKKKDK